MFKLGLANFRELWLAGKSLYMCITSRRYLTYAVLFTHNGVQISFQKTYEAYTYTCGLHHYATRGMDMTGRLPRLSANKRQSFYFIIGANLHALRSVAPMLL
jgi:hypothetical protein